MVSSLPPGSPKWQQEPCCHGDQALVSVGYHKNPGEVLQTGDEAADGAVAVSPADELTQTVRGGLDQPVYYVLGLVPLTSKHLGERRKNQNFTPGSYLQL
ncbi:hypothetical protein INR49_023310 [Caranx melampygus]|nr:hypothetical protein INR49_023310 [Caranx melampygus]